MSALLDAVSSLKVKLGLLVATSVVVAVLLTLLGSAAHVSPLLVLPVSVALALGVTQLLAAGMVAPLRRMTDVSRAMARGDTSTVSAADSPTPSTTNGSACRNILGCCTVEEF